MTMHDSSRRAYDERRDYLRTIKTRRGCIDCGATGPVELLDFDHRPGQHKVATLLQLAARRAPWDVIDAEVAKCDVRCRSCHSRRHAAEPGRMKRASLAARGVPRPRRWALTPQQATTAAARWSEGTSLSALALEFGTTHHSVKAAITRIGASA